MKKERRAIMCKRNLGSIIRLKKLPDKGKEKRIVVDSISKDKWPRRAWNCKPAGRTAR
jgi:hypothetical protein